jgi:SAM-dependent methyltransferase
MRTIEQILSQVPDKREDKDTTSHEFKKDLYDFFWEDKWRDRSILEVSCNKGYSSYVLSHLFKQVYAVDFVQKALNWAEKFNQSRGRKNIQFIQCDVYKSPYWAKLPKADVVFLDADHRYNFVVYDIRNAWTNILDKGGYIIIDDYGLPASGVKRAVDDLVKENKNLSLVRYIGEPTGSDCRSGRKLLDWEGVILKYE